MKNVPAADARIVLVPGGFTGAWMWADVAALLAGEGIEALAVELPTIGEDSAGADFYADARAVRELLDGLEPPVLLCGHSYGGAVITQAAAGPHPAVRELVYLTAAVPGTGDSMVGLMSAAAAQDAGAPEELSRRRLSLPRPRRGSSRALQRLPARTRRGGAPPAAPDEPLRRRSAGERGGVDTTAVDLRAR